jgi:ParB/RepB/Spo0J family partition protein
MKELNRTIETLPIKSLIRDPNHTRVDLGDIEHLVENIRKNGLLAPVNVNRAEDGKCYFNDGWRRIEALKKMGEENVLCVVGDGYFPEDAAHQFFMLNKERKALNAMEEATHIHKMNTNFGLSFRHLEIRGYGSASILSKKAQLVQLPDEVKKDISEDKLSMAHGLALLDLSTDKERVNMAQRAQKHEWSAPILEKAVRKHVREMREGKNRLENRKPIPETEIPGVYIKDAKDMSEQPDGSIPLVVSSPPYFVGQEYEQGYTIEDHWDNIGDVLKECARVLAPGGVIALNLADISNYRGKKGTEKKAHLFLTGHIYQQMLKKHKINLESQIVWNKGAFAYSTKNFNAYGERTRHAEYNIINRHEFIYIFRKDGERVVPEGIEEKDSVLTKAEWSKYVPSIWDIATVYKSEGHPAVFPDELVRRLVKMFSFEGEKVLDPFLGSGTTVKVAQDLGRVGIGYERVAKYKTTIMEKLGLTHAVPADEERLDDLPEDGKELAMGMGISKSVEMSQASEDQTESDSKPEVSLIMSEGMKKEFNERAETALEPA